MNAIRRHIGFITTLLVVTACVEEPPGNLAVTTAVKEAPSLHRVVSVVDAATQESNARQLVINTSRQSPPEIHPEITIVQTATAPSVAPTTDMADQPKKELVAAEASQADLDTQTTIPVGKKTGILGAKLKPGTLTRLSWHANQNFDGINTPVPVLVAKGTEEGPTLCLTAAVHGDELNGIEVVRRVLYNLNPLKLKGSVVGVPIVNIQGFSRNSRYLPDRRDLNRFFPGNTNGSAASRLAYSFFNEVIRYCDALVDLHTGSFHRTNLPQIRADLNNEEVLKLTEGFGSTLIMHNDGAEGTLRRAAVNAGIPAVTFEAGEPSRIQQKEVEHTVKAVNTLLDEMGIYSKRSLWGAPEPVYYTSKWVRADSGGILFSKVKLGRRVKSGELLGTITDPITNDRTEVMSPYQGRIIGMAVDQFVMPGFAAYHIGIETSVDEPILEDTQVDEGVESEHAE